MILLLQMICGVPKCKKNVTKYGVCDFHKAWYFLSDEKEFNNKIKEYKNLMINVGKENCNLQNLGYSITDIEKCWDGNFSKKKDSIPENLKNIATMMENMDIILKDLENNYDHKLVHNCTTRARHQCNTSIICACICCKLKIKIK